MPSSNDSNPDLELLRIILLSETTARLRKMEEAQGRLAAEVRLLSERLQQLRAQKREAAQRATADLIRRKKRGLDKKTPLQEKIMALLCVLAGAALAALLWQRLF